LKTHFDTLLGELDCWPSDQATIWWRDDDAVADTPQLRKLLDLSRKSRAPVALAAVPLCAGPDLAAALRGQPGIKVWQHGYAHTDHATPPAKKAELGDDRLVDDVIGELESGRNLLRLLFSDIFDPVLVPPWNRIGPAVRAALPSAGFDRLSTVKARSGSQVLPREVNIHADIIDWRGAHGFIGEESVVSALVGHLAARRRGEADRNEPTGILSHHLIHDRACWDFLADFLDMIAQHPAARLMHPDDLPW
jgi:hypothetical protein